MSNFFDMKTRYVKEHVDSVIENIKRELQAGERKTSEKISSPAFSAANSAKTRTKYNVDQWSQAKN